MSEYIRDDVVKIRKDQQCWGCTLPLLKGSECLKVVSKAGRGMLSTYWCKPCEKLADAYDDNGDGLPFGLFRKRK